MNDNNKLFHRLDIQGLRAIAIILVVLSHTGVEIFAGGFVGVDIFFVLSGYLISRLLIFEYKKTEHIKLGSFFAKRLKRLLPSLVLMVSFVTLGASLFLSNYEYILQMSSSLFAATWTSNLYFALTSIDYFSQLQTKDMFLHTWSLGVEEQFYLAWPLLLLFIFTFIVIKPRYTAFHTQLLIVLAIIVVISLSLSLYWSVHQPLWSFYFMPSRVWQFSLGAWIFIWFDRPTFQSNNLSSLEEKKYEWLVSSGLFLVILSAILLKPDMVYPSYWALFPSIGAALIIASGSFTARQKTKHMLAQPALVWIGDRSYSWYLWHWPILILGGAIGLKANIVDTTVLVLLSLLLSMLSYRWVELPFWKGNLSHYSPLKTILLSILIMLVTVIAVLQQLNNKNPQKESTSFNWISKARVDMPLIYSAGCDAWYQNADVRPCLVGAPDAPKLAILLGDSIGAQWFSLLPEIFKSPQWRIQVLTKSACAIVNVDYFYSRIGKNYSVCSQWRNASLDYISKLKPDIVIVGSAADYEFSKQQWINGSKQVFSRLSKVSKKVVIIPGTPKLSFDGPSCLTKTYKNKQQGNKFFNQNLCREVLTSNQARDVSQYLKQAAKGLQNVSLLDLNELVCPQNFCAALSKDNMVIFRDNQHLTDTFVRAQVSSVLRKLKTE